MFELGKTRIRITFFFAVGLTLFSLQTDMITVFSVLSAVILHEAMHLVCVTRYAGAPQEITVGLFGMRMTDENLRLAGYKREAVCALAAPFVNLICFAFLFGLSVPFPQLQTAAAVHVSLGLCNLLPLRCLDGGRGLLCILYFFYPQEKAEKIMNVTEGIFFFVTWGLLLAYIIFLKPTPTAVVFLLYLTFLFLFRK